MVLILDPDGLRARASLLASVADDLDWTVGEILAALRLIGRSSTSTSALVGVVESLRHRAGDLRLRATVVESLEMMRPALTPPPAVAGSALTLEMALDLYAASAPTVEEWISFYALLTPDQRSTLATSRPAFIGSQPGAPLDMRVTANRVLVTEQARLVETELAAMQRDDLWSEIRDQFGWWPGYESPDEQRGRLERERAALKFLLHEQVILFDWTGAGSVAVWHGALDAPDVVVYLPGTGHNKLTVPELANRSVAMVEAASPQDLAVITAMVYDAPDNLAEAGLARYADRSVDPITEFVSGLRSVEHLSLLAHSYGSTALGTSLRGGLGGQLQPDTDVIIIGSPGTRTDSAGELGVDPRHVWVGLLPGDEIRITGVVNDAQCVQQLYWSPMFATCDLQEAYHHGRNPAHEEYGAQVFETGPNPDVEGLNHGKYWAPESLSLVNMVLIALGEYHAVRMR